MKSIAFYPILMLLAAISVSSCGDKPNSSITQDLPNQAPVEFTAFADTTLVEIPSLTEIMEDTAYGVIFSRGIFPIQIGDNDISSLQTALLKMAFNTVQPSINQAIIHNAVHSALNPDDSTSVIIDDKAKLDSLISQGEYTTTSVDINIMYMNDEILSLAVSKYNFIQGSAHGVYETNYLNYYIPKAIVLDINNIFDNKYSARIIDTIRAAAREQYDANDGVSINDIKRYNNFFITPDGAISFTYSLYEIACYAAGEITITVPSYSLMDYMTPLGKEVFGF